MPAIVLPWPDPRLFPNWKRAHHWSKYRGAEKAARKLAWELACEALPPAIRQQIAHGDDRIRLTVTFIPPDRRKRDDDGCIGAIKNMRDGIADALGCDDARFRPAYAFGEPCKPGRVEITIGGAA